jgi:hypothetical protein
MPRSPLTIPDDGQDANGSPPLLGEHTREVLENLRRGGEVPS